MQWVVVGQAAGICDISGDTVGLGCSTHGAPACMYVCMYVVCMYVMYVCMYVRMYVCMYVRLHRDNHVPYPLRNSVLVHQWS